MQDAWNKLRSRYPWPVEPPDLAEDWHGWLCDDTARALTDHLGESIKLVVECGTWLGCSARAILTNAPNARLICVDHWIGSSEHQPERGIVEWSSRLPTLKKQCQRNLWPWRDRVVMLQADSLAGLGEIADLGLVPDLLYVDSEHTHDRVSRELGFITYHWPAAWIVGDDYNFDQVGKAAREHGLRAKRTLIPYGAAFVFPPEVGR